jgi:hypothetical protein
VITGTDESGTSSATAAPIRCRNERTVRTPPATRWTARLVGLSVGLALGLVLSRPAAAEEATRLADNQWPFRQGGRLALDGGLVMAAPMTLPTGMATGVGGGLTFGRRVAIGARASWASATESSLEWTVRHDDYRLRGVVALQGAAGRGVFALRLGLGATVVHEARTRNQATLSAAATALLPGGEVEAALSVHVLGPWLLALSGGPAALVEDGALHGGWIAQLGVGWQP